MKLIVNTIFGLCFVLGLYGQNYISDEFIVQYTPNASALEQQTIRNLYGITSYIEISGNDNTEVWTNINYPIQYTENGETTIIDNVEELLWHIGIQDNDDSNEATSRSDVQEGDLNYIFDVDNSGILHDDGTFQPLPLCDEYANDRLFFPAPPGMPQGAQVKIIIVDQYIPGMETTTFDTEPSNLGGIHGVKVHSVISNILTQANVSNVEYINYPVFDSNGTSTVASMIEIAAYIREQFDSGIWNASSEKVLVNFSANLVFPNGIEQDIPILRDVWYKAFGPPSNSGQHPYDVMVISSAGNQGTSSDNIFPGALSLINEITVAGAQDCFSAPWVNTNSNNKYYEIAAEAKDVLTFDGDNYYLSDGTSYASAMVTAAIAQMAVRSPWSNLDAARDMLLANSPSVPALFGTVKNGKVLDLNQFLSGPGSPMRLVSFDESPSPLTLQATPNPFTHNTLLNIQVPIGESAQVSIYNTIGQLVHYIELPNEQELTELQWYTPDNLPKGTYMVRVQAGEQVQQQMIVKQ